MHKKKRMTISVVLFLRYLAESNRSSRFCRPVPNLSAKVPVVWDCKYSYKKRICKYFLLHIEKQSLKILSLRMIDVDTVIGRLIQPVKDADRTTGLGSCREDCKGKSLLVDHLGTAEGKHQTSRTDLGDCCGIEPLVGPESIVERPPVLCESRRIHDDQIILVFGNTAEEFNRKLMGQMGLEE